MTSPVEWIPTLVKTLHDSGYRVTGGDAVKIAFVVDRFLVSSPARNLANEDDRKYLSDLIGPIVCTTPVQQSNFYGLFDLILTQQEKPQITQVTKIIDSSTLEKETEKNIKKVQPPKSPQRLRAILILVSILIALSSVILNVIKPDPKPEPISQVDTSKVTMDSGLNLKTPRLNPEDSTRNLISSPLQATTYLPNVLAWVSIAMILALILSPLIYVIFYFAGKAKKVTERPFRLVLPSGENHIQASPEFEVWGNQLQQRDEGDHKVLDVSSTISATIRSGGFPMLSFKRAKRRPHYLILIDSRSSFDQRTKLYTYLSSILFKRGIDIDVYYFNASPHYCWNHHYPQGIKTESLQQRFPNSYLILVTDGQRLMDENMMVAKWVENLFDLWSLRKAILTSRAVSTWGSTEENLYPFFLTLPLTPKGLSLLRPLMDAGRMRYADLKRQLIKYELKPRDTSSSSEKAMEDLSLTNFDLQVKALITQQDRYAVEKNPKLVENLRLWALAAAVNPEPSLEFTIAAGRALEKNRNMPGLVTTTNLLIITSLPWLKLQQIPATLHSKLLEQLRKNDKILKPNEKIEQVARIAAIDLLKSAGSPVGSRAELDKEISINEQRLYLEDKSVRKKALANLRSFQKSGLIYNKGIHAKVDKHFNSAKLRILAGTGILLSLFVFLIPPKKVYNTPTAVTKALFIPAQSFDSAGYYNRRAFELYNEMKSRSNSVDEFPGFYEEILSNLRKSIKYEATDTAILNLHIFHYDAVYEEYVKSHHKTVDILLGDVPDITLPFHPSPSFILPRKEIVIEYLKLLIDDPSKVNQFVIDKVNPKAQSRPGDPLLARKALLENSIIFLRTLKPATPEPIRVDLPDDMFKKYKDYMLELNFDKISLYYQNKYSLANGGAGSRIGGGSSGGGSSTFEISQNTDSVQSSTRVATIFTESFSGTLISLESKGWRFNDYENNGATAELIRGSLIINTKGAQGGNKNTPFTYAAVFWSPWDFTGYTEMKLSFEMTILESSDKNNKAGIYIQDNKSQQFAPLLLLFEGGTYHLSERNGKLSEDNDSNAIKKGIGVTNKVEVLITTSDISYMVNSQLLRQIKRKTKITAIGLDVISPGPMKVAFDNLSVTFKK